MRLFNTKTYELEYFATWAQVPPYAILSHTWSDDEVSDPATEFSAKYPHLQWAVKKEGWKKIEGCCQEAEKYGVHHLWIDTICINKRSSSELTESINSMWAWYRDAKVCLAYLEDVSPPKLSLDETEDRQTSRWFTRGWTLQELIAPKEVFFFYNDWTFIGTRAHLASPIHQLTQVPQNILERRDKLNLNKYSVAERFLWASRRFCTREEDRAYSLLGLMGVVLPVIYGEGYRRACYRLQLEVFKATADQSMFAWRACIRPWEAPEKLIIALARFGEGHADSI
ncbi:HET-domain-containing protein [Ascodesmis nigricans]|uniref:HET-domain-containing protein n=1 Tax=Ascodesmis nigricans TaxID=341454 RepID=A0A4S2N3R5_9PEZI|nr:HET-domain-containing protein [Ascodesmis nigricans]